MAREKKSPPAVRRRPFKEMERQQWALLLQTLLIDGLAEHAKWTGNDMVFHGGTSLKLGWGSPRWSEDLDFLVRHDLLDACAKHMKHAVAHAEEQLLRIDAQMKIELREKKSSRIARYQAVLTKPGVLGKAAVKAEFWGAQPEYLEGYASVARITQPPPELADAGYFVRVRAMLPTATLNSILCDKILAVANRPYLKSRDIFDMWWLQQERDFKHQDWDKTAEQVLFHASAYDVDFAEDSEDRWLNPKVDFRSRQELATSTAQHIRQWADSVRTSDYLQQAQRELHTFLVASLRSVNTWEGYWKDKVKDMIEVATTSALACAQALKAIAEKESEHYTTTLPKMRG